MLWLLRSETEDCCDPLETANHIVFVSENDFVVDTDSIDRDAEMQAARRHVFDSPMSRNLTIKVLEAALSICKKQKREPTRTSDLQIQSQAKRLQNFASDGINSCSESSSDDLPPDAPKYHLRDLAIQSAQEKLQNESHVANRPKKLWCANQ